MVRTLCTDTNRQAWKKNISKRRKYPWARPHCQQVLQIFGTRFICCNPESVRALVCVHLCVCVGGEVICWYWRQTPILYFTVYLGFIGTIRTCDRLCVAS